MSVLNENNLSVLSAPSIRSAAQHLTDWLDKNCPIVSPRRYEAEEPNRGFRRSVQWIVNERTLEDLWDEDWFKDGIVAFTLIALELEGAIRAIEVSKGIVYIFFIDKGMVKIEEFCSGELSPEYKYDPEFSDMDFCAVNCMSLALEKYDEPSPE